MIYYQPGLRNSDKSFILSNRPQWRTCFVPRGKQSLHSKTLPLVSEQIFKCLEVHIQHSEIKNQQYFFCLILKF